MSLVYNGHGILDPAGVSAEDRANLSPEQTKHLDRLIEAVDYEAGLALQAKELPQNIHNARLALERCKKRLNTMRPPVTQADLVRASIRQSYIDRGLPPPSNL